MRENESPSAPIHPVILSGGSGTRLWPVSRSLYPKQLLPLAAKHTMLQETARRFAGRAEYGPPLIVCNDAHRFIVAEQLRALDIVPQDILLEPVGRNTAPAVAAAALVLLETDPAALILVLPSDHVIGDTDAFHAAVAAGAAAARRGALVTFGIKPTAPETGYGYIRAGAEMDGASGCAWVERFVEKPDRDTAEGYLAEGGYFWNSGMFLFQAAAYLTELERLQPDMVAACRAAITEGRRDLDFLRLDADAFAGAPSESVDYAVMEHTEAAAVVPAEMGWNDVGSWSALWDIGAKDAAGNVAIGDVVLHDTRDSYLRSDEQLLAAVGIEGMVVIVTDDAVLVAAKDRVQEVRAIAERLKADNRDEVALHSTVYRPWGSYRGVDRGDRFQVKRIVVKPGGRLSLQKHHRRAEHWVVVSGTAKVTRGEAEIVLKENESTYIPLGVVHRLENIGTAPLQLIEVQSGDYLGEDDIVRLEDSYGRD